MSKSNYPKTPKNAADLHAEHPDIVEASEYAYSTAAGKLGRLWANRLYRKSLCRKIAMPLCKRLVELGYDFKLVERNLATLPGQTRNHLYARSSPTPRGLIITDGVWQQFVPNEKRTPDLPKVAVGTPEEVIALAQSSGVHDQYLDFWRVPPPDTIVNEKIVNIYPGGYISLPEPPEK